MPFDGFGNFLRLYSWVVDATNSVKIRADRHDDEDNNFMAGLSQCITKDGQTAVTQNIPLNSRRLVSVADPVDPQDAATKAYADTKMPLDGSAPIIGDVIVRNADPSITLDGTPGSNDIIYGDKNSKHRWAIILGNASPETGSNAGSDFNLINFADDGSQLGSVLDGIRSTGLLSVKANPIAALGIATKQYADTVSTSAANSAASTKLPLAGGIVTGELVVGTGYLRFTTSGGPGYIQWSGGGNYSLGGGGTIWHSGNFNPAALGTVADVRLALAGDVFISGEIGGGAVPEPFLGAVMTGVGGVSLAYKGRFRWLQINKGSGFVTVGTA